MSKDDLGVDIEAACAAARRYAQLVHYHDNSTVGQCRTQPFRAWRDFMRQFAGLHRGVLIVSLIGGSYRSETNRLVEESKARRAAEPGVVPVWKNETKAIKKGWVLE